MNADIDPIINLVIISAWLIKWVRFKNMEQF